MIHYNNDNNAYCSAINAQTFEKREHNTVKISTFLYTRNLYSYSYLEIFICMYSVRGEIDQISTNTFKYTTCCSANVYMLVYILIGAPIVPLRVLTCSIQAKYSTCYNQIMWNSSAVWNHTNGRTLNQFGTLVEYKFPKFIAVYFDE